MLQYKFDEKMISIQERASQQDTTYVIEVKSEEMRARLKQVRQFFDENRDYTDVMFYSHEDGTYEAIVREDMKNVFLIHAFRFQCLTSLRWA